MNLLFIVVLNILAVGYATPDHEEGLEVEDPAIRGWRKGDHTKGVQRPGYSYKRTLKFKRSEIERNATKTNIRW